MTDRFTTYDAAYLLGALSPQDRREFEAHLRECEECSRSVARLAGLPGLLAKAAHPAPAEPVPATLLPRLIAEVTRARRRARRRLVAAAGAAAAVVAVLLGTLVALDDPGRSPDDPPVAGVAMDQVVDGTPIRAEAVLDSQAWGTDIRLTCTYDPAGYGSGTYRLVVTGDDGTPQRLATWSAVPGQVSTVTGSTSLEADEIATVEIRDASDRPVLTLDPDSHPLED
jgi:hypothetical protein